SGRELQCWGGRLFVGIGGRNKSEFATKNSELNFSPLKDFALARALSHLAPFGAKCHYARRELEPGIGKPHLSRTSVREERPMAFIGVTASGEKIVYRDGKRYLYLCSVIVAAVPLVAIGLYFLTGLRDGITVTLAPFPS